MSSYSHFFSKTFQHICVSLDVNFNEFNESLTNDIVSFEQLSPGHLGKMCIDLSLLPGVQYGSGKRTNFFFHFADQFYNPRFSAEWFGVNHSE